MFDTCMKYIMFITAFFAIAFGLFLAVIANSSLLSELLMFFSATNVFLGLMLIFWQLKGKLILTKIISDR